MEIPFEKYEVFFFDFDGVILDSVGVKTIAFSRLFESYGRDIQEKVIQYHLNNGGVSRYDKFRFIYKNFLKKEINDKILKKLDAEMNKITMKEIQNVDFVEGMPEFLEKYCFNKKCYIVSATPEKEIKDIVNQRKLFRYFLGVYGSPKKKDENIKEIIIKNNFKKTTCLMFGDSINDKLAAESNAIDFVGIKIAGKYSLNNFKGL